MLLTATVCPLLIRTGLHVFFSQVWNHLLPDMFHFMSLVDFKNYLSSLLRFNKDVSIGIGNFYSIDYFIV